MKYKVFDIVLGNKLNIKGNEYRLINRYRVISDNPNGDELTLVQFAKIIKSELKTSKLTSREDTPAQVIDAVEKYMKIADEAINHSDIENFLDVLRAFGYDLLVVARADLDQDSLDKIAEADAVSYLVLRYQDNQVGCSAFYTGRSQNYAEGRRPLAYDYMDILNVSAETLSLVGLDNLNESYNLLSQKGMLNNFDDTVVQEFLANRGYKFYIFYI